MTTNICKLRDVQSVVQSWKPDVVVSAVPTSFNANDLKCDQVSVPIEDIYNVQLASYKSAIRDVLKCSGRVLVHCEHGKSRSAALALAKSYQEDPESVDTFLQEHPEAEPNPLLLLLADEILKANGDLLRRCAHRYKGRHL